jgi:hypothetical protein
MGASFPVLNDVDLLTANNYMYPSIAVLALHNNALTGTIPRGLGEMELSETARIAPVLVSNHNWVASGFAVKQPRAGYVATRRGAVLEIAIPIVPQDMH